HDESSPSRESPCLCLPPSPRHHVPTPFPYTTLFRSSISPRADTSPWPARRCYGSRAILRASDVARGWPATSPGSMAPGAPARKRSEEHTSELQSRRDLVCRLLLDKKNKSPVRIPAGI